MATSLGNSRHYIIAAAEDVDREGKGGLACVVALSTKRGARGWGKKKENTHTHSCP